MNKLLAEAIQLNITSIEERNALVQYDLLPVISVNRTTILQVLQNLIGNALKYQRPGEQPMISISAEDQGTCWQFAVADNGIGIEEQFF